MTQSCSWLDQMTLLIDWVNKEECTFNSFVEEDIGSVLGAPGRGKWEWPQEGSKVPYPLPSYKKNFLSTTRECLTRSYIFNLQGKQPFIHRSLTLYTRHDTIVLPTKKCIQKNNAIVCSFQCLALLLHGFSFQFLPLDRLYHVSSLVSRVQKSHTMSMRK